MLLFRFFPGVVLLVGLSLPLSTVRADGWTINPAMSDDIASYKTTSVYMQDMFTYGPQNNMVYVGDPDNLIAIMPIYELFACMQLSYPDNHVIADTGGSVHFEIEKIPYAKGAWDTVLRMQYKTRTTDLDQEKYVWLNYMKIGINQITDVNFQQEALKILAKNCVSSGD